MVNTIVEECSTNIVSEEKLKDVQLKTLSVLKECLIKTYGPMGSYTDILSGTTYSTLLSDYSKDGLKVLKHIIFDQPIEMAIQTEIRDICQYVDKNIGDGTTSAVILSSLIFSRLLYIMKQREIPPRKLVKVFNEVVEEVQNIIESNKQEITLDAIYNICMISTNGNKEVSSNIRDIYETYGFDVTIDYDISNDTNTKIVEYDGLVINEGYKSTAFINNINKGTTEVHNARVYGFESPIDTPEMIQFFESILYNNIIKPLQERRETIPTVIVAPTISADASGMLTKLTKMMYEYDKNNMYNMKPQIIIVDGILGSTDEGIASDIEMLCDCKPIKKYINPEIQEADQKEGKAPTVETVAEFYGTCELVIADSDKTKFINPSGKMNQDNPLYNSMIAFLEAELKKAEENNDESTKIGSLKKRLKCLKSNMVSYLVGGVSVGDRNALKDLVEDAVKNCASAASNGYGRAANFEGFMAIKEIRNNIIGIDTLKSDIVEAIHDAYFSAIKYLYISATGNEDDAVKYIERSIELGEPINLSDIVNDGDSGEVICSIRTDIEILNAISKIITMMVTSNQCLVQAPNLNKYV